MITHFYIFTTSFIRSMNAEAIYCSIWIICISQCIVVTLLRCTGQFCKLLSNFFSILCAKNYNNSLLFDHVIHFWRLCRSSLQFMYVAGVRKCEKKTITIAFAMKSEITWFSNEFKQYVASLLLSF